MTLHVDTVGDTVIVQPAFRRPPRLALEEDLRIGRLEGDGPDVFGHISDVAVRSDGTILLFDSQVPALQAFDGTGGHVRTYGREGEGPGEYSDVVDGLAVDGEGRVFLRDLRNNRVNVYGSEGEWIGTLERTGGLRSPGNQMVVVDTTGHVYVRTVLVEPGPGMPTPWPIGFQVWNSEGMLLDTLVEPPPIPDAGAPIWAIHPDGRILVGSALAYRFEIRGGDGSVVRVAMPHSRPPYSEAEVELLGGQLQLIREADGGVGETEVEELKPTYTRFHFDSDGRIWARRSLEDHSDEESSSGEIIGPFAYDVFKPDGIFIGTAQFPPGARPLTFSTGQAYVVETGEYDEQYLVRYRLSGL